MARATQFQRIEGSYGLKSDTRTTAIPRRVARMASIQRAAALAWKHRRRREGPVLRVPAQLAAQSRRGRLGRDLVAEGVRRARREADRAGDPAGRMGARRGSPAD